MLDWAGFGSAITYTFDDANSSQIDNYDTLQALGVPFTFYLQTNKSEASSDVWARAVLDGHELGNHTKSHLRSGEIAADTDEATAFIQSRFGVEVWTMAAPFGDAVYADVARPRFLINRGVSDGLIAPNASNDRFNLDCHVPATGANVGALNRRVDDARSAGRWLVVLVHGFTGGTDGAYQPIDLDVFVQAVQYAKSFGDVWIGTMVDVGAYWVGQKLLTDTVPERTEGGLVWRWSLPDNFPPGKTLRVTSAGGALSQAGAALAVSSQGIVEVSLDAGELTLVR